MENEMTEWKHAWMFFSVAAAALDDELEPSTLTRWAETGLFTGCPFGAEDRYIRQGVRQVQLWLEDLQEDPRMEERREQDYLQLFIGTPTPLAPFWGSVYMEEEKLLFHAATAQAGKWYRRYGLGIRREKGLPEDSCLAGGKERGGKKEAGGSKGFCCRPDAPMDPLLAGGCDAVRADGILQGLEQHDLRRDTPSGRNGGGM